MCELLSLSVFPTLQLLHYLTILLWPSIPHSFLALVESGTHQERCEIQSEPKHVCWFIRQMDAICSLTLYCTQPWANLITPTVCVLPPSRSRPHPLFSFPAQHLNQDTHWHWYVVKGWDGNCASCSPLFVFLEIEVIIRACLIWRAPHCDTTSKHLWIKIK